jgi:purine nucleosidase
MTSFLLDTDIGTDVDDALALALFTSRDDAELVGVTTTHGHATLRAIIARALIEPSPKPDVRVVEGRSEPLRRSSVDGFHWHSMWGHEGSGLLSDEERRVEDAQPRREDAARFIIDASKRVSSLRVVSVGPVTNLGLALQIDPTLAQRLGPVTVMGGLVDTSTVSWPAYHETNLNADPMAAEIVLGSGLDLTLVPLEVTLQVFLTRQDRDRLAQAGGPVSQRLVRLIEEMREPFLAFSEAHGLDGSEFDDRTYMHDPLAVHVAMGGGHATLREAHIAVEYDGQILRTVEHPERKANMRVCTAVDGPAFVAEWVESVIGT